LKNELTKLLTGEATDEFLLSSKLNDILSERSDLCSDLFLLSLSTDLEVNKLCLDANARFCSSIHSQS